MSSTTIKITKTWEVPVAAIKDAIAAYVGAPAASDVEFHFDTNKLELTSATVTAEEPPKP